MKKAYFILFLILITQVYALNETNPAKNYRCGDGIVSLGEDCTACPSDVKCLENEMCISGRCRAVEKTNISLVIGISGGILIIAILVALFLYYKRRKELGLINIEKKQEEPKPVEVKTETKEPEFFKEVDSPKKMKTVSSVLLKNFILDRLTEGETRQTIINKLEKAGWKREKIDLAFAELAQEHKEKIK